MTRPCQALTTQMQGSHEDVGSMRFHRRPDRAPASTPGAGSPSRSSCASVGPHAELPQAPQGGVVREAGAARAAAGGGLGAEEHLASERARAGASVDVGWVRYRRAERIKRRLPPRRRRF